VAGLSPPVSSSKVEAGEVGEDDNDRPDVVMGQDDATHSSNSGDEVPPTAQRSQRSDSDRKNARGHGRAREKGKQGAPERASDPQSRPPRRAASSSSRSAGGAQTTDDGSVRELFRKAYARESLHTYKSDPLHRGKGRPAQHRDGTNATGKGQPDMRLRMNALLEKIKRDAATG
jgi:hypothetical protein